VHHHRVQQQGYGEWVFVGGWIDSTLENIAAVAIDLGSPLHH